MGGLFVEMCISHISTNSTRGTYAKMRSVQKRENAIKRLRKQTGLTVQGSVGRTV